MAIDYEPIKPEIGARIRAGKDEVLDPAFVRELDALLAERIVLVFPELHLTDEEQLAFTDLLGERVDFVKEVPGADATAPGIYKITLDPTLNDNPDYVYGTYFWHMDGVMEQIPPPRATLLSARAVAAKGGQTEFANLFAAWENLPEEEKRDLEGLRAVHSVFAAIRPTLPFDVTPATWQGIKKRREHPLVWTHADGRRSLLVGTHAEEVVGMGLPEGRALLTRLLEWAAQPAFTYRHHWKVGDFVVWLNPGALHRVIPYDRHSGRVMHRTSIAGTEPIQ
ncbi:MAG: taurine catabolism dioxygenase [Porticoccaceae bacterium]|nr:MAG: taurine catabolism dioxygenase [Porticoccaceae bacterium]